MPIIRCTCKGVLAIQDDYLETVGLSELSRFCGVRFFRRLSNVACGFIAPRSSAVGSQLCKCLQLPVRAASPTVWPNVHAKQTRIFSVRGLDVAVDDAHSNGITCAKLLPEATGGVSSTCNLP